MHTIHEFRNRLTETLPHALTRPVMYGGTDFGAEMCFYTLLSDLCWIDERETEWKRLEEEFIWGPGRVLGQLADQEYSMPGYINEVTSTYAQLAHMLGYYLPERLLPTTEWQRLLGSLTDGFFGRDWTESQLHNEFGQPSHEVIGGDTTVACYAPGDAVDRWVFFDISRKYPHNDDEWFEAPILRDVRLKRNRFRLLPFADWCGPGHTAIDAVTGP